MSSAEQSDPGLRLPKPRVLIAGTQHAIGVLQKVLADEFHITVATSIADALAKSAAADLVMCNVQFDDSRMFEFVHALRESPGGRKVPVICCRVHSEALTPNLRRAIEQALDALGIAVFVDRPFLMERYHASVVDEMLRQLVLDRLPPKDAGR